MIVGTVTTKQNQPKLKKALKLLAEIKEYKLAARTRKYANDGVWHFASVIGHLDDEVEELHEAINNKEKHIRILDEIADVSNCLDLLVMMLIDNDGIEPIKGGTEILPGVESLSESQNRGML